jgi:DNA-binding response OmpR family regulator
MAGDPIGVVLVVEDDANIRELICEALTGAGLEVVEAADGEAAVRAAREHRPAAIVLDIGLPLLDGTAVADQVRDMYGDGLPFIVVTAGGRALDISRIRALAEITKPFAVSDLVSVVVRAIAPQPADPERATPRPAET